MCFNCELAIHQSNPALANQFEELDISIDLQKGIYWCNFNPKERPCFTPGQLADLRKAFHSMRELCNQCESQLPIRWFVSSSKAPGIYNYGGDLKLFLQHIRNQDRQGLQTYAEHCVDLVYHTSISMNLPITTIALLQGDALGGGFEAALACDFIIAEKQVKIGLPESTFNLFPGMGAYSFLSRRIGTQKAKAMIFSGRTYSAQELLEWGAIDHVVETGMGKSATLKFIEDRQNYHNIYQAMKRVSAVVQPVSREELLDVVNIWVEATLNLNEVGIRKMERLLAVQTRKWERIHPAISAEVSVTQNRPDLVCL